MTGLPAGALPDGALPAAGAWLGSRSPPHVSLSHVRCPLASLMLTGLLFAYAYQFCCGGSPWSTTTSDDTNRPTLGSYSLAPRCVSPVGSTVPPTNPFSFGQLGTVPLAPPNGVSLRTSAVMLLAVIAIVAVPCWSDISQRTPADVRIATCIPACV
jgi:hypothetical protein